jgi:hypothetical protein
VTRPAFLRAAAAVVTAAGTALAVAGPVRAEDAAADATSPPAVHARLDTSATTVGGALDLVLEVEPAEGWTVDPPTKAIELERFRVRAVTPGPPAAEAPAQRAAGPAWTVRIVPVEAGEIEVPPVTLTAHGPDGRTEEIASDPVPVTVASNLPPPSAAGSDEGDAQAPEPADLKPALEPPRDWRPVVAATVAAAAAAALGFWLLRKLRRRPAAEEAPVRGPKKPLRPAWETALEALDRIAAADYVGNGQIGRQYVEVTGALRQYLEERYGVPALESTTADLDAHLQRMPIRGETSARILSLLREADLVKFAKARPEPADARAVETRAREVVLKTVPSPSAGGNGGAP